ncbi:hypothetical protein PAI11_07630 [Patulibacter medicamentivorans]|uniref:Regulatory protein n=1 Tax=Patulibacter medicamentivorans TaxID=1097667 RepID=H0E1V1_9ACTN|nr:helix-turn-helix domain-containing protein [Patulibacter medicamentivorans]EHN12343.1 hypothetical protein PAI11_07630 [Patulibacter medicamentivorans]
MTPHQSASTSVDPRVRVRDGARALAREVDGERLARLVSDAIAAEVFPDRLQDSGFREALDGCVHENVRSVVLLFEGRLTLEDVNPLSALAFADLVAELGIPVSVLERTYWVGVARLWQAWFDLVVASGPSDGELPALLGEPTTLLFAYVDLMLGAVVSRHDATRRDLLRTREHLRRTVLAEVLDGRASEQSDELDRALGYRMRGTHVALVIELGTRQRVESEVAAYQEAARATGSVLLQEGARTWVAWLGRADSYGEGELTALRRALQAGGARIAVGEPATGIDGFRRSREQALRAARVQRALEPTVDRLAAVTWYADVRLEALLLADERCARQYVVEELGPLAADDVRCARMRETLLAWLSTGTQAGTAASLGLHENTVRHRIRQAEALLPGVLSQRRTELQVALRLERILGAAGPD